MKPILFAANATTFTSNGLGSLDPTKCVVTEERNGQYEMECVVPTESAHFSDIANNMILVVIPGDGMTVHAASQRQAFRIYHITEPMNGLVTINARHISYDLSYNTVMPFTADGILTAFSGIVSHMVETNPFSFNTDKSTAASFKVSVPQTARQLLGGQAGSILDVYGGEYQWDNWTVDLWSQRGTDSSVTLRYGKNITDISQEENLENVVTGIVPFWAGEDSVVTLPEKSVDSAYASSYPYKRTVPVDFSSEWEDAPTESQLRSRAQSYITANKIGVPKVSIKVSFVALWQTDEYKSIAPLERVHLCDTVGVVFEKYGINTRAEVIKTEWDCLAERYTSIELGDARSNFARTIVDMNDQTQQEIVEAKTDMQKAIDAATAALTGVKGGHIRWVLDSNNEPQEMLIMDTDDISTARVIWRYNVAGWGVSTDGGQTYTMAAVLDTSQSGHGCQINADYMVTGHLSANLIQGGVLKLGGNNNGNGTFELYNSSGTKILTIDNTGIYYNNNKFKVDANGNLKAQDATLTGADVSGKVTSNGTTGNVIIENGKIKSTNNIFNTYAILADSYFYLYDSDDDAIVQIDGGANTSSLYMWDRRDGQHLEINVHYGETQIIADNNLYLSGSDIYIGADMYQNYNGGWYQGYTGSFYDRDGNEIKVLNGSIVTGL